MFTSLTGVTPDAGPGAWPSLTVDDEIAVLAASGLFDEDYYLTRYVRDLDEAVDLLLVVDPPDSQYGEDRASTSATIRRTPLEHFCRTGWRDLKRPRADFDVWWYWSTHLDLASDEVNPLLHYVLVGQEKGLATCPELPAARPSEGSRLPESPRRVCLFAGYDRDGVLDGTVVDHVRELARFADVYYLADCAMEGAQLEALHGLVQGAWAFNHGGGHLGSHARLACHLVGWDTFATYDEVVLADDSGYLVGPLDTTFDGLRARPCDWWAITTAGAVPEVDAELTDDEIHELPESRLEAFTWCGPLVGLRTAVLSDPTVRGLVEVAASGTRSPRDVTGLARLLLARGLRLATLLDRNTASDPLLAPTAFELVHQGVPYLSKGLLVTNPYLVPGLSTWKEQLASAAPGVAVDRLEADLLRATPDDALRRSMSVTVDDSGEPVVAELLEPDDLVEEDRWAPKFSHWWAFPVCAFTHQLSGNERAVFEEVADDPSLKKIVLTRSRSVAVHGQNVVVVPLASAEGQQYLLRAGQVFVKHGARINVPYRLLPDRRNFINLWHGIPLKRFGLASHGIDAVRDKLLLENSRSRAVVTSSRVDSLAMAAAFSPLSVRQMWPTGLPRNDFVLCPESRLPDDMRRQLDTLRGLLGDRRLVLFCPTFRDDEADGYYRFSADELTWLEAWQARTGTVIGVREHMADTVHSYSRQLDALRVVNLSAGRFPDVELIYRIADGLVSDYSSCLVDFLLTGKPVVSFAYDYEAYRDRERGLFYELEDVLPGPVCSDFAALARALDSMFEPLDHEARLDYERRRGLFFDHLDDRNTHRVVQRVKRLYAGVEST